MWLLKPIKAILRFLRLDANPHYVGIATMFGFLIGFQPFSLYSVLLFIIFFIIKSDKSAWILSFLFFKIIANLIEPGISAVGSAFLEHIPALIPIWTALRNIPIVPLTKFYNTVAMGGFVIGIVFAVPMYFFGKWFYTFYNTHIRSRFKILQGKTKQQKKEARKIKKSLKANG